TPAGMTASIVFSPAQRAVVAGTRPAGETSVTANESGSRSALLLPGSITTPGRNRPPVRASVNGAALYACAGWTIPTTGPGSSAPAQAARTSGAATQGIRQAGLINEES